MSSSKALSREKRREERETRKTVVLALRKERLFFLSLLSFCCVFLLFCLCVVAKLSLSALWESSRSLEEEERLREKIRTRIKTRRRPERENCSQREMMRAKLVLDVRGCSSSFSSSSRCGGDDDDGDNNKENKRKKKMMRYARVTKRTPPKRDLGLVRVDDEQLTCGAKLDLDDDTFVISRVTKTYTLVRGKYVEDEKRRVEVESLERSLLNRQLSDVFKRS